MSSSARNKLIHALVRLSKATHGSGLSGGRRPSGLLGSGLSGGGLSGGRKRKLQQDVKEDRLVH